MKQYYADLHTHSKFSKTASPDCDLSSMLYWARLKGISVCGCGDCTHPEWFDTLKESLLFDNTTGLYKLKDDSTQEKTDLPENCLTPVYFMVTGEISCLCKREGKTHKIHSLILLPSLNAAEKFNSRLSKDMDLSAEGRPVLNITPHDLLEILLEIDHRCALIPAHIWAPWHGILGFQSGFNSLEECFGDLTKHIFAVETGLSSDTAMNHRISFLQNIALISNSDLHMPCNLGRNANCFYGNPSYENIINALSHQSPELFKGTVDFFPEKGKYYYDGHRLCGVCLNPQQSRQINNLCPICNKPLTIGALHRVMELEKTSSFPESCNSHCPESNHVIPLHELLSHKTGKSSQSNPIRNEYMQIIEDYGPELPLLIECPEEQLREIGETGEMILQVRHGNVDKIAGYDGIYGNIVPQRLS